jgi:hypothetical protein
LRGARHASTSVVRRAPVSSRRPRPWRDRTENSESAMFRPRAGLGVGGSSSRSAILGAAAGAQASSRAAGECGGKVSLTIRIPSAVGDRVSTSHRLAGAKSPAVRRAVPVTGRHPARGSSTLAGPAPEARGLDLGPPRLAGLVAADPGPRGVVGLGVQVQGLLPPPAELGPEPGPAPRLHRPRLAVVGSAAARRSCPRGRPGRPASSSGGPAGAWSRGTGPRAGPCRSGPPPRLLLALQGTPATGSGALREGGLEPPPTNRRRVGSTVALRGGRAAARAASLRRSAAWSKPWARRSFRAPPFPVRTRASTHSRSPAVRSIWERLLSGCLLESLMRDPRRLTRHISGKRPLARIPTDGFGDNRYDLVASV